MINLLYTSVFLAGLIIIQELSWIGKTDLAAVILGLAIAVGSQGIYLLYKEKN